MYKQISIIIIILSSINSYCQQSELPRLNFETYVFPIAIVVKAEGNSKSELKNKISNWITNYYRKSQLSKTTFEENYFIIEGYEDRLLKIKNLPTSLVYKLKLYIRDSLYKFEVTSISYKYYTEVRPIENTNLIKDEVIKNDLNNSREFISSFFNKMNQNLFKNIMTSNEDW